MEKIFIILGTHYEVGIQIEEYDTKDIEKAEKRYVEIKNHDDQYIVTVIKGIALKVENVEKLLTVKFTSS